MDTSGEFELSSPDASLEGPRRWLDVLFVDDDPIDQRLMVRFLSRAGYAIRSARVCSADHLRSALRAVRWDLVISDHRMPRFSAIEAVNIVRQHDPELPIIVVSDTMDDGLVVETIAAGVRGFVAKDHLSHLGLAVEYGLATPSVRRGCPCT